MSDAFLDKRSTIWLGLRRDELRFRLDEAHEARQVAEHRHGKIEGELQAVIRALARRERMKSAMPSALRKKGK